jgi:hypothetical protein
MERRSLGLPHVPTFRAVVRLLVGFEKTLPDDRIGGCPADLVIELSTVAAGVPAGTNTPSTG